MIKLAGVARQPRFDLTQPLRSVQLRQQHRNQMSPRLDSAIVRRRTVLFHKLIKLRPRNLLQQAVKNDILMRHGVDPFHVQMIRNQLNRSRINAVHFLKQNSCRTPVGQARA